MKNGVLFFGFVLLLFSCTERTEETGTAIVEKSIEAHGGWEAFNALNSVSFYKTTRLFLEDESIESQQLQLQEFKLKPIFLLRMQWMKDTIEHAVFYDRMNVEVFEDSIEVKASEQITAAKKLGASAEYVFFQPFKLVSDDAQLDYVGQTKLFDSIQVKEVVVRYPNEASTIDRWSYFFNDKHQLIAAKVAHQDRTSLILNTSFQTHNGILFNKTRKSYFVDSLNRVKYLRADYDYLIK